MATSARRGSRGRRAGSDCRRFEPLEGRQLLAAANLFFPPAAEYPSEPLREPPVIEARGGRIEAGLTMVRAGFDSDPILYGGRPVLSSPPDPNSPNNPDEPVYAMAYRVDAYGESYPAQFPGPIFRLDPGEEIAFDVQNDLADADAPPAVVFNSNLHAHGLHASPLNDGDNVYRQITPGEGLDARIPVPADHPHGLNWYHVHRHGSTHDQVYGGLAGFIVVGDPLAPWPEAKATVTQRYLALSEVNIRDGRLANYAANRSGPSFAEGWQKRVNGQVNPTLTLRPGETQVWNLGSIGAPGACPTPRRCSRSSPGAAGVPVPGWRSATSRRRPRRATSRTSSPRRSWAPGPAPSRSGTPTTSASPPAPTTCTAPPPWAPTPATAA